MKMNERAGIVADGAERYLKALEEEALAKRRALQTAFDSEEDPKRRDELMSEMKRAKDEFERKRRAATTSLF